MSKIKKLAYLLAMLMFVGVGFSSCDKSMDEPLVSIASSEQEQMSSPRTTVLSRASSSQYFVKDEYKDAYYSGYRYASNYFDDEFVKKHPIGVGFYAAYNCSHTRNNLLAQEKTLFDLCSDEGGSEFRSYTDANQFQLEVESFLSRKQKPVVVSIETMQTFNDGTPRNGTVIIWASNQGVVTVTNTNFSPSSLFGDNDFYYLTYSDLLNRAKKMSKQSPKVGNVAYMDSFW